MVIRPLRRQVCHPRSLGLGLGEDYIFILEEQKRVLGVGVLKNGSLCWSWHYQYRPAADQWHA